MALLARVAEIPPLLEVLQMAVQEDKQAAPAALVAPVAVVTVVAQAAAMVVMAAQAVTVPEVLVRGLLPESLEKKAATSMPVAVQEVAEVLVEQYMAAQAARVVVVTVHLRPKDTHM